MGQRIRFYNGKQKEFLDLVQYNLNVSSLKRVLQFGIDVSYSALKKYRTGKLLLPNELFENLCHLAKIDSNTLKFEFIQDNWGQIKGGKNGIKALQKKYPREIKKWRKLAMLNSPVIGNSNLKKIKVPELNEKLAEFIGAYLGDGTITPYQIKISGDYRFDIPYYNYLSNIIFELFGIYPSIHKNRTNNSALLLISSKNICSFLNEKYKIAFGDKIRNQTKIPKEIMQDDKLAVACLRGLMDTDGSVSRRGNQFCIQFTNHNKSLLRQVIHLGKKFNVFTFFDKTGTGSNSWNTILNYFKIVGSSNLKHIIRFDLKLKGIRAYRADTIPLFEKDLYRNLILPFKILGV